jgi:hypothetical protein
MMMFVFDSIQLIEPISEQNDLEGFRKFCISNCEISDDPMSLTKEETLIKGMIYRLIGIRK